MGSSLYFAPLDQEEDTATEQSLSQSVNAVALSDSTGNFGEHEDVV